MATTNALLSATGAVTAVHVSKPDGGGLGMSQSMDSVNNAGLEEEVSKPLIVS